jgi:signal transduction histidine kinase
VSAVTIAAIVACVAVAQPVNDVSTLLVGALVVVAMSAFSVPTISGVAASWSAVSCVHLAMTLAVGPPGAIAAAIGDGFVGRAFAAGNWFRSVFNTSTFVLTNLSAWSIYHLMTESHPSTTLAFVAGVVIGAVAWTVDHLLVAGVVVIASHGKLPVLRSIRSAVAVLPHTIAYGVAAAGAALLHAQVGILGFVMVIAPLLTSQFFLVRLAKRSAQHRAELQMAEDAERRRIARDLHDGVVQVIAGYAMSFAAIGKTSPAESDQRSDLIADAANDLRQAAEDLRTLIVQIAPPSLDGAGITAALDRLANPLISKGVKVQTDIDPDLALDSTAAGLIFRVTQELLRNILRHANATVVRLQVQRAEGSTSLTVNDNGRGFDRAQLEARQKEGHVGLRGLQEIAEGCGASLEIDSVVDEGTTVRLTISAGP